MDQKFYMYAELGVPDRLLRLTTIRTISGLSWCAHPDVAYRLVKTREPGDRDGEEFFKLN